MSKEFTLSSPLSNHLYGPFLDALWEPDKTNQMRERLKLPNQSHKAQATDLAISLSRVSGLRFAPGTIVAHTPNNTGTILKQVDDLDLKLDVVRETLQASMVDTRILYNSMADWLKSSCVGYDELSGHHGVSLPDKLPDDLCQKYRKAMVWQSIIESCPASTRRRRPEHWATTAYGLVSRDLVVLTCVTPSVVCSYDVVLMMKDIAFGAWLTHLYSMIDRSHSHMPDDLSFITNWGFTLLETLGNTAYEIIKGIEPLLTCRLIELSEEILDSRAQTQFMLDKYTARERKAREALDLIGNFEPAGEVLIGYVRGISDPNRLSQIYSMMKMCGHPYVNALGGCAAKEELSKQESTATYMGIKSVEWSFCHMFTKGFIDKRKHWPGLIFKPKEGRPTELERLYNSNHQPLPLGLTIYDPSDWDYATFTAVDDFDYGEDILSLVTDKSLSYKRSELASSWSGALPFKTKEPSTSKRVVIEALKNEGTLKEVCQMVVDDTIPYDWHIVTVHPKEREMKVLGRIFAMMVFWMRCFFNNLEANLATKIFPYIPQQTMTMNAKEEEETFLAITKQSEDTHVLTIGLDLSSWNTHFTAEMTDPIGHRLNQLLGVQKLYTFVHRFFEKCIFILRHPSFVPTDIPETGDPPAQPGIWFNDGRGNEGTCQKFWAVYTLAMLHWDIWRFGVQYTITCQADNLVLYVTVARKAWESPDQYKVRVRDLAQSLVSSIETAATNVGHEVKAEECSQSTRFCTYGKNMWFKGVKLESSFKVLSRMFPHPDSDMPTLHSMIGTLSAQGSSMTDRSNNTLACFMFSKFLENWMIRREFRSSVLYGKPEQWELPRTLMANANQGGLALLLSLIPSNLGGLPVSCLAEFLYRGHSDPLSSSLGSLSPFLSIPIVNKYLTVLDCDTSYRRPDTLDISRLIDNPFDIPLDTPPMPGSRMSRDCMDTVINITRNKGLKTVLTLSRQMESNGNQLVKALGSMRPFYPVIAHEIYRCSVYGAANGIMKSLSSTKTISDLMNVNNRSTLSRLRVEDIRWFGLTAGFLMRVYSIGSVPQFLPVGMYSLLTKSRKRWGIDSITGVSNCHPLMNFTVALVGTKLGSCQAKEWASDNSCIITGMSLASDTDQAKDHRGPIAPYLGDYTEEKAVSKWAKPVNTTKPLRDVIRLLQIAKMITRPGSQARAVLEGLVSQRSDLPLHLLYEFARDKFGGTTGHRFSISDSTRGSFSSSLSNWATHISISTNLMRDASLIDYPLSVHEYVLSIITMSNWLFRLESVTAPFGLVYRIHTEGLPVVSDAIVETEILVDLRLPLVRPLNGFYYLRADSVTLVASSKPMNRISTSINLPTKTPSTLDGLYQAYLSLATSRGPLIPCGNLVRSSPSITSVVDMPEVCRLTFKQHMSSLALVVLSSISLRSILATHKNRPLTRVLEDLLIGQCLVVVPQSFGTFKKCPDRMIPSLFTNLGRQNSRDASIYLALMVYVQALHLLHNPANIEIPTIFEKGVTVLSSDLLNRLSLFCVKATLLGSMHIVNTKLLVRIALKLKQLGREMDRVMGIVQLLADIGLQQVISRCEDSPQLVLRRLREATITREKVHRHLCGVITPRHKSCCTGTGSRLEIGGQPIYMSPSSLYSTWQNRPYPGPGDAAHRWRPITPYLNENSSILIVGIGVGGLLRCIPDDCSVYGLELPSSLTSCGHDYITYKPAFDHPNYKTLPDSWISKNDISTQEGKEAIVKLAMPYDTVIIDAEGIKTMDRVILRHMVSCQGPKCWVRCFDTPDNINTLASAVCSTLQNNDDMWLPEISDGTEILFGSSPSPMGLFVGVGHCIPKVTPPCTDNSHTLERCMALLMCCLVSGVNPTFDPAILDTFLDTKVRGISPREALYKMRKDNPHVVKDVGRHKLRCFEYLSRYVAESDLHIADEESTIMRQLATASLSSYS